MHSRALSLSVARPHHTDADADADADPDDTTDRARRERVIGAALDLVPHVPCGTSRYARALRLHTAVQCIAQGGKPVSALDALVATGMSRPRAKSWSRTGLRVVLNAVADVGLFMATAMGTHSSTLNIPTVYIATGDTHDGARARRLCACRGAWLLHLAAPLHHVAPA